MALLKREQILKIKDIKQEEVFVQEWDGSVIVKGLTGAQRDAYEASLFTVGKNGKDVKMNYENAKAKLVALSMVDEEGNQLFELADVEALGAKSASAINTVYEIAEKLSGLKKGEVEELTKN